MYSILMEIPFVFTHKINTNDPFYNIIESLVTKLVPIYTLDDFPPLSPKVMGENHEM
jgi:hypothetical protein